MLTALLMNQRPRAKMLFVGPTHDVADEAFQAATGMIEADPYLAKRFRIQEHLKTITDRLSKAKLSVKTFDMKVMTGSKPVVVLLDELHVMSSFSFASRVIGQIRGGFIANPESLLIIISTQSDEPPSGPFKAELQRARGIRDGRITGDVRMLPILYEFPEAMQVAEPDKKTGLRPWENPDNWPMVLPNLGLSISIDRLISDFKTARDLGMDEVRRWASQHLNVEIGLGLHAARWRGADYWEKAAIKPREADDAGPAVAKLTLAELLRQSEVVVVGGDGGGLDDLLGMAVLGRCKQTRDWLLWNRAWAQSDVLELRKDIAEKLRDFDRDGDLVICQHPTQDVEEFAAFVAEIYEAGLLPEKGGVGLDPAGAAALIEALNAAGVPEDQLVGVPQGYRLSGAVWGAERKLKDRTFRHAGQAMMAWCVGNAKSEQRGNAVLITKETAGKAKIDPLVAAFNAVALMSRNPDAGSGAALDDYAKSLAAAAEAASA